MQTKNLVLILLMTMIISLCHAEFPDETVVARTYAPLAAARSYTQDFYEGKFAQLHDRFSQTMQNAMSVEDLAAFQQQVTEHFGAETEAIEERLDPVPTDFHLYQKLARFEKFPANILIVWALDADMVINGFSFSPMPREAETEHLEYQTRAELILPFENEWITFWGGRTVIDNYHAAHPDQRFAYDFLQSIDGKTHTGTGDKNEDYFCFGKPVLAPARGTIIAIENGIPDNVPGEMNPENPLGNYVIIDHGNDEYSFLSHFKQHSISVEAGEQVIQAQIIGLCGNSGNSSEAHIHYHLQNTPVFGKGEGLPAQFKNYMHNANFIESGEPTRGQQVSNHLAH